jgi:hypothetical protein
MAESDEEKAARKAADAISLGGGAPSPDDSEEVRKAKEMRLGAGRALTGGLPGGANLAAALLERRRARAAMEAARKAFVEDAIAYLQRQWGERACPYCGQGPWEIGTPFDFETSAGPTTTHFPVMCSNCGQTAFVNAVRAGLVPEPPEPQP